MKILIAGAGKVGKALTEELSSEGHDITLIDNRARVLEEVMSRYDVITLQGNAASKQILEEAGVHSLLPKCAQERLWAEDFLEKLPGMSYSDISGNLASIRFRNSVL